MRSLPKIGSRTHVERVMETPGNSPSLWGGRARFDSSRAGAELSREALLLLAEGSIPPGADWLHLAETARAWEDTNRGFAFSMPGAQKQQQPYFCKHRIHGQLTPRSAWIVANTSLKLLLGHFYSGIIDRYGYHRVLGLVSASKGNECPVA